MSYLANLYDTQGELWRIDELWEVLRFYRVMVPHDHPVLADEAVSCDDQVKTFTLREVTPRGRLIYDEVGA